MTLWVDALFISTIATAQAAQAVVLRAVDERRPVSTTNPLVPKLEDDQVLRSAARFISCRDAVARLNAYSPYDWSGAQVRAAGIDPGSAIGNDAGLVNDVFEVVRVAGDYDLDAHLAALVAGMSTITVRGQAVSVRMPDAWAGGGLWGAMMLVPRGVHGVVVPLMDRTPTGDYSPGPAQQSAALLDQLRVIRQAANVTVDAGLAATAAANWAATRADLLAQAQAAYPERGYA